MTPHEKFCLDSATHFTAVRGRILSGRTKEQFDTMREAEDYAKTFGDGRTMIYAINDLGNCAHIKNA